MTRETVGAWNAAMASAPVAPAERLIGAGGLVVIAPHPDDETFGASALLVAAGRLGRPIGLVALTDGEGSHRASRTFPPERLAGIRTGEQACALAALDCGTAEVLRLGLPDGASGRDPRFAEAVQAVAALCDRLGATALSAPHPDDPHPDHHAAADLAFAVRALRPGLRVIFYEVWSRRLLPDEPFRAHGLTPFRVATDIERKQAAIACHHTQLGTVVPDDPAGFVLPDWFLQTQGDPLERHAWLAMPGRVPDPEHFARLYAGDGDPWHVRSSSYEAAKREASIGLLAGHCHRHALEAGCGEGFLTRALVAAGIAERATGFDREPAIVERANRHPETTDAVSFRVGSLPDAVPDGVFDLVVLSEVLYFLDEAALAALAAALCERMAPGARLLLVSYLGPTDTPLSGRDASDLFVASLGTDLRALKRLETGEYRAELLQWRQEPAEARADAG